MTVSLETGLNLIDAELPALRKLIKVLDWHIGGSTAINYRGNDVDLVVLTDAITLHMIRDPEWKHLGEESYCSAGLFDSYRKGDLNLIITDDPVYYTNWLKSRAMCIYLRQFGLDSREIRVAVHSIICDGRGVPEVGHA